MKPISISWVVGVVVDNLLPVGQIYFTFKHIFLTKKRFSSAASEGLVNKLECLFGRRCVCATV